jgi:peptide deformylase
MFDTMYEEEGIGLAANQAGLDLRLVVIETEDKVWKIINPQIRKKRGSIIFEEGCLSFPGLSLRIKRAKEVWVDYLDVDGNKLSVKAEDILAVAFQHEIDHIDGILFIDRIPYLERLRISSQLLEIKKKSSQD